MSQQLISRSADLQHLQDEGYEIEIVDAFLVMRNVPYVNARKEVKRGSLVSTLAMAGDVTIRPDTHVVFFAGDYPCDAQGQALEKIRHNSGTHQLHPQITVDHSFSSKPHEGYSDYYAKMTTYAAIVSGYAQRIDPSVSPQTRVAVESSNDDSVFLYTDTASSRASIGDINHKLALERVGIVGAGGTGAYVLDLVAKTPVREIHLFDNDEFSQHNAFRCPGAASLDELRQRRSKVAHLSLQYGRLRRGIIPHETLIDSTSVQLLRSMNFVFVCIDSPPAKKLIAETLIADRIPFVDVGLGVYRVDDLLGGILRVTTATPSKNDHVTSGRSISFGKSEGNDEYARNIQVADLNALNAALAVVKWKKLCGFYLDLDREHNSLYTLDGNDILNGERT
jgi:hypothetical protein